MAKECMEMREKYWSELNDSDRIERMRMEVKRLQAMIESNLTLLARLAEHSHNPSGQIVVPITPETSQMGMYRSLGSLRKDDKEIYF